MNKQKTLGLLVLTLIMILCSCTSQLNKKSSNPPRPNIILILADDMGFSDLGCYGSEIQTPNLDALAKNGVRYTQFYNAARCCPTRASLISGVYPHQAGMGWMTNANLGTPAYQGDLAKNVATIAEVLRPAGYNTYMTGKWHLSNTRKDDAEIEDNWPVQRGFDEYFGIVAGAGNYFNLNVYSDNKKYHSPDNFYLTNAIGDSSAMFIEQHFKKHPDNPMFMYVAFTSPHWPLHALEKDIEKYKDIYNAGWDEIRQNRLQKQLEIGLWEHETVLTPRDDKVPEWDDLSLDEKKDFARRMAIYAAQVDAMDQGVGQIVAKLKELKQLDNTVIFFLSDNGGCAEYISSGASKDLTGELAKTYESYRINWANVSNTPFREYKHWVHEGGIRTPLIVHWPEGINTSLDNKFIRDYGHLTDIMATCVELAGATYPDSLHGEPIVSMQGTSLLPHFSGKHNNRGPIYWEHEANIGMRKGDWKLVAKTPANKTFDENKLELYNIKEDPTELHNLAEQMPEKRDSLYGAWCTWADYVKVYPLDTRDYGERSNAYKRKINGEFDMDFGDWNIVNPNNQLEFTIDRSGKISGKNSAQITVLKQDAKSVNGSLQWVFPNGDFDQYHISFHAVANNNAKLTVLVEQGGKSKNLIAQKTYSLSQEKGEFSFQTKKIERKRRYRLIFSAGDNPEGTSIWLDAIVLKPVK